MHLALSPQLGGSAFASLEEVVARLARAKVCAAYPTAREGLLVNARFLLGQLEKLDLASGHKALKFLDTDFGRSLQKEVGPGWGAVRQRLRRRACYCCHCCLRCLLHLPADRLIG